MAEAEPPVEHAAPRFTCMTAAKQPSEMTCITCGAFHGHDGPLVSLVLSAGLARLARDKDCRAEYVSMLPGSAAGVGDLLDALGYARDCCRTHLVTRFPHVGLPEVSAADLGLA